jgi:hypothetical protein
MNFKNNPTTIKPRARFDRSLEAWFVRYPDDSGAYGHLDGTLDGALHEAAKDRHERIQRAGRNSAVRAKEGRDL